MWVIDDLSTGSIDNIDHVRSAPNFHFHFGTILDIPLLAELVDRCDVIYHLAAAVGVRLVVESPVRTIETNIRGTEAVLNLAHKKRKLVLITSTSEVYGKANKTAFAEEDDLVIGPPTHGRWSYASSKAIEEFLALSFWKEKHLPVVVVRLFNTVGPRQTGRYGMVLPNFVAQALMNEPITVFGSGKQSRCFTYVGDAVKALEQLVRTERAVGEIFNVGSNAEVTIERLAQTVRDQLRSQSRITYVPYEQAYEKGFEDMMRRVPDLRKIERYIGYRPSTSLPEIIQSVAAYLRPRVSDPCVVGAPEADGDPAVGGAMP